jgi:hypothetical protein
MGQIDFKPAFLLPAETALSQQTVANRNFLLEKVHIPIIIFDQLC